MLIGIDVLFSTAAGDAIARPRPMSCIVTGETRSRPTSRTRSRPKSRPKSRTKSRTSSSNSSNSSISVIII